MSIAGVILAYSSRTIQFTDSKALGKSDVIVVVNPNNPDGRTYRPDQLEEAASVLTSRNGFLIVDEAFGDVMPELSIIPNHA